MQNIIMQKKSFFDHKGTFLLLKISKHLQKKENNKNHAPITQL